MCELEDRFGKYDGFEYRPRVPRNSLVGGVGINDAPFVVAPTIANTKLKHPAYQAWQDILKRCYNGTYKENKPTYKDVTCCTEWLTFTTFSIWFKDNYKHGYYLDKDLLVKGNKIYSPNTCVFVSVDVNNFILVNQNNLRSLPLGVDLYSNSRFRARISSKGIILGVFDTPEEAHKEWQKAKLEQAIAFNFPPLQRVIDQLKFEIENNLETTTL